MTSYKRSGPTQVIQNIIKNLDHRIFEAILITIYNENSNSQLADILPFVSAHYLIKTGKMDIILGRYSLLKTKLQEIAPDVIHSTGVFPDYVISKIYPKKQILTLHSFAFDDFISKFGRIRAEILIRLHIFSLKKAARVIACSKSLSKLYKDKLNISVPFIRNGIDLKVYASE